MRFLAWFLVALSPSPLISAVLTEISLHAVTVDWLARRLESGELPWPSNMQGATSSAAAEFIWSDIHEINFPFGSALMVACGSSIALATAGVILVRVTGRNRRAVG